MTTTQTSRFQDEWLNGRVMYGGMAVRRTEVIRHLRECGVDEHSIGYFTLKDTVKLTAGEAAEQDAHYARLLQIEALEAEGMTFSDAQAVLMAQEMSA